MDNPLDDWFAREILVHEAALMRYLLRWWPHRDDVPDLRQEIYIRIYEAAAKALPQQPKSLLFTAARNLMADRWRRNRVVRSEEHTSELQSLMRPSYAVFSLRHKYDSSTQSY